MTTKEKYFINLAKDLIERKGSCKDGRCDFCLYRDFLIKEKKTCFTYEVFDFSIEFLKKHKDNQLEFEF